LLNADLLRREIGEGRASTYFCHGGGEVTGGDLKNLAA